MSISPHDPTACENPLAELRRLTGEIEARRREDTVLDLQGLSYVAEVCANSILRQQSIIEEWKSKLEKLTK